MNTESHTTKLSRSAKSGSVNVYEPRRCSALQRAPSVPWRAVRQIVEGSETVERVPRHIAEDALETT